MERHEHVIATACRVCGCTDDDCSQCIEKTGHPCHWIEPGLCSACATETERTERLAAAILEACGYPVTLLQDGGNPLVPVRAVARLMMNHWC